MGQFDSTKTRVMPVFDQLIDRDLNGKSWLNRLVRLPTRSGGRSASVIEGPLIDAKFGEDEAKLEPPRSLLRWLVINPGALNEPASAAASSPSTLVKRRALLAGDRSIQADALAAIDQGRLVAVGTSSKDVPNPTSCS